VFWLSGTSWELVSLGRWVGGAFCIGEHARSWGAAIWFAAG